MTADELARRRADVQVVDVRRPNEWEAGRIEGAVHVPDDELTDRVDELDRARPVVAVCLSGRRSAEAAEVLRGEGFSAENLEGGLEAWTAAGLPFEGELVPPDASAGEDELPPHLQRLQDEFMSALFAVQEHFGDREPSEEEVRAFLRERLIGEGKSPEEADRLLDGVRGPNAADGTVG